MDILVSILKHKNSCNGLSLGQFKVKFEADWGTESGLEEKLLVSIMLLLLATTRPNMVFAKIKRQLIMQMTVIGRVMW